ncbi:histidine phosphatase family protein [Pseudoxanthomonas japonensis]|uniref:histidine phosphatase family protein n=1 Tax=Pseudoxanthomonas japonensis TaxID=69284 RepID=UPI001BCDC6DA|nr:histidine phosphatase family protein [Pseudoxanthomonas japonensis]
MPKLQHTDWPDRLWVVRHGQSAGNVARDAAELSGAALIDLEHRDADTPLSELGERQAGALATWFGHFHEQERPKHFLSSPFVRARQTCVAIASQLQVDADDIHVDERLREKEFGILDRYTVQGIRAKFPELAEQRALVGKFYFRPPGGESWCDVILRLRSVVEVLRRDHVGDRVVIVAHQVIVNCFRYLLECLDERAILDIDKLADVPNCSVTEYGFGGEHEPDRFSLRRANYVPPELAATAEVTVAADTPAGPK